MFVQNVKKWRNKKMINNSIQATLALNLEIVPTYPIQWIISSILEDYTYTNLQKIRVFKKHGIFKF
jgi:hypothetical protein